MKVVYNKYNISEYSNRNNIKSSYKPIQSTTCHFIINKKVQANKYEERENILGTPSLRQRERGRESDGVHITCSALCSAPMHNGSFSVP